MSILSAFQTFAAFNCFFKIANSFCLPKKKKGRGEHSCSHLHRLFLKKNDPIIFAKMRLLFTATFFLMLVFLSPSFPLQHNKCATYSAGMQKTYSLICLAMEDERTDKTKKVTPKLSFLSWGTKNRQKAASTLCLPSAVSGTSAIKKKLTTPFTLFNNDSSLY